VKHPSILLRRAVLFSLSLGAAWLAAPPCLAVETAGAPAPVLPPPPPPALVQAPSPAPAPSHAPPGASPATGGQPPSAAAASSSTPSSASSSSSFSSTTALAGAEKDAPDAGPHAFDTRPFLSTMLGYLSDYLDFGIGLRGGKTLDNHVYLGGTFVYQIGESGGGTVATPVGASSYSWSSSGFYIGPEGGYDFDLKYVVVRPYMGLGIFNWSSSASGPGGGAGASSTRFVVWPGGSVIWNVPDTNFFLGGDLRLVSVPGTAFGLYAMGGMHFGA
jgi:hypothetical protein